jgi:hypothetical protein
MQRPGDLKGHATRDPADKAALAFTLAPELTAPPESSHQWLGAVSCCQQLIVLVNWAKGEEFAFSAPPGPLDEQRAVAAARKDAKVDCSSAIEP